VALHQIIQRLLLLGAHLEKLPPAPTPVPPAALLPLIESIAPAHRAFDARAVHYGHRYRSGFWAIYLLSAVAVLFAVLPLALGWDSPRHVLHSYAALWAAGEVIVIGAVSVIYWMGRHARWQEQWLRARTTAELSWYLPLVAPLLDFDSATPEANWYLRVFDPGQHLRSVDEVASLCARHESMARRLLVNVWSNDEFVLSYAQWTMQILEQQRHYHHRVATRQHALVHRVHVVNTWLFGLTAIGACMHLALHTIWLSLLTTFFPALGASLHGALAQSEAYRLDNTSRRLVAQLSGAIDRIRTALGRKADGGSVGAVRIAIQAAMALILEEHQDWHLLVRPHQLPLA
jgi:hypothetical protein